MQQGEMDRLNKEAMDILGYEKPPDNFTSVIMDRIQRETLAGTVNDNPIIGRWGWILIIGVFILLFVGFWLAPSFQFTAKGLLSDAFINNWWMRYVKPSLSAVLMSGKQFGLLILIGISATFLLFADRLIGNKLAASKTRKENFYTPAGL